jgi:hypothetical protein
MPEDFKEAINNNICSNQERQSQAFPNSLKKFQDPMQCRLPCSCKIMASQDTSKTNKIKNSLSQIQFKKKIKDFKKIYWGLKHSLRV